MRAYIQNTINRFWANGQNFIEEAIKENLIQPEDSVGDFLKLAQDKQKEYPRVEDK